MTEWGNRCSAYPETEAGHCPCGTRLARLSYGPHEAIAGVMVQQTGQSGVRPGLLLGATAVGPGQPRTVGPAKIRPNQSEPSRARPLQTRQCPARAEQGNLRGVGSMLCQVLDQSGPVRTRNELEPIQGGP